MGIGALSRSLALTEEHGQGSDGVHAARVLFHFLHNADVVRCILLRHEVEDQTHGRVFAVFVVLEPHLLLPHRVKDIAYHVLGM